MTAFMAAAKPAPRKKTPSTSAPAMGFHFTHADSARPIRARMTTSARELKKIARASHKCSHIQEPPDRPASMQKRIRPGIQVISETSQAMTQNFPSTYSTREKGRQKYSGSALLARSGEMSVGP